MLPLTPASPALAVLSSIDPLDVLELEPLMTKTLPPDALASVSPAVTKTSAPWWVADVPTWILTSPLLPPAAFPVPRVMVPDSPAVLMPVEMWMLPLMPAAPALAVRRNMDPEEVSAE